MSEVILFPLAAAGHMNPMFHLAEALHSKGMSVTFILNKYNSPSTSHLPSQYTFHFIDDGLSTSNVSLDDPVAVLGALNAKGEQPFRECLAAVLGSGRRGSKACLITDPLWKFTRVVCQEFGLPRIMLHTSTVADLVILSSPNVLQHEDYSIYPEIIGMVEEIKASNGLICNSFEELEGPSLKTLAQFINIPIFPVGPLHKYSKTSATNFLIEDKTPIISWLDSQLPNSVLYISFGSLATITKDEFDEISHCLTDSNQAFLWVVRPDLVQGTENATLLVEGFVENVGERGRVVTWAPQQEVLAHEAVGGAFMHGGWNSTLESISEGVPVICMPCLFPDQKTIAWHVSEVWKVGLRVERGVKRRELTEVVTRLMIDQDIRERMASFKEVVNCCLREGGSSYESLEKLEKLISTL